MEKWLPVAATVVAGGLVALQAPINSTLGKSVGTFAAASISFAIGLVVLVAITLVAGGFGDIGEAADLKWYYLTGGMLGAIYVTTVLLVGARAGRRRRDRGDDRGPARRLGADRPRRACSGCRRRRSRRRGWWASRCWRPACS